MDDRSRGGLVAAELAKGARITGEQRMELGDQLARRYAAGESIRALAEDTGRSFGFVHGLVKESGAHLRGRGGATRGTGARAAGSGASPDPNGSSAAAGPRKAATADATSTRGSADTAVAGPTVVPTGGPPQD